MPPVNEEAIFPDVGRWISVTRNDFEFLYKILKYEYRNMAKVAVAMDDMGLLCYPSEGFWKNFKWKYIEEPSYEELDNAKEKRFGYRCSHCDKVSTSLKTCTGCMVTHYCNMDCLAQDWKYHKEDCKQTELVLKPNPRYPLAEVDQDRARATKNIQDELNKILKNALSGKFKVNIDWEWKTNPRATDLRHGASYTLLTSINEEDYTYRFKFYSLDLPSHSTLPGACDLLECLMLFAGDNLELHDLVASDSHPVNLDGDTFNCPGIFWGMVLNYNTFGTVAPFNPICAHKFPKMPSKWRRVRKCWDEKFSRAKTDIQDVQCMFADIIADTEEGCHAFGLPGDDGCKFKHDMLVAKEKKKKKVKESGSAQDVNGNPEEEEKKNEASGSSRNEKKPDEKKEDGVKDKRPWQKKKKTGSKKKNKF